jgi:hypothetical protein
LNATTETYAAADQPSGKWDRGMFRILFYSAMAGAAVGVLNFAAVVNGWNIYQVFDFLNDRLDFPFLLMLNTNTIEVDVIAIICFWSSAGMLLALSFWSIRMLVKRKAAK